MNCPECSASVPKSELEFEVGSCHSCNCRIWKKRIPGIHHTPSFVIGFLMFLMCSATNFIPRPDMSTIANGIEKADSCYGVPFLVSHGHGNGVNFASVATNAACSLAVAMLAWAMTLGFFRHAWYQHHFGVFFDDEEEPQDTLTKKNTEEIQTSGQEVVVAQLVDELPETEPDEFEVVVPNAEQLKMMTIGANLVFWAGCLTTVYLVFGLIFSILSIVMHMELTSSIGGLILIGVILDLAGRIFCLNSANINEQATSQIVLACSVITIVIVVVWVLSLVGFTDSPAQIKISFVSVCLGLLLLIVGVIGTAASIGYCGAISNNTGDLELRQKVVTTRNAFILLAVFMAMLIPLAYAVVASLGKRNMNPDDFRTTVGGVIVALQLILGLVGIFATVQHLLMYRCAEKFLVGLARHREKNARSTKDPFVD